MTITPQQVAELIRGHCAQFTDRFYRVHDEPTTGPNQEKPFWIKTLTQGGIRVYVRLECPTTGHAYGPIEVDSCPNASEFGRAVDRAVQTLVAVHSTGQADAMDRLRDTLRYQV